MSGRPRALVTGAGMVGAYTARALIEHGWAVTLVDRVLRRDYLHALLGEPDGLIATEADLTIPSSVEAVLRDPAPDAVIHTAALVSARAQHDVVEATEVNVVMPVRLAQHAAARGVRRFVATSTWGAYAPEQHGPITEESPLSSPPVSYYTGTKLAMETLLGAVAAGTSLAVSIVRPTVIYGHGPHLGGGVGSARIEGLLARALDGQEVEVSASLFVSTELTYAGDVANVLAGAARRDGGPSFEVFTIGSQQTTTAVEFVETVTELFPHAAVRSVPGSGPSLPLQHVPTDVSRALRELGIPRPLDRRAGFRRLVDDLRRTAGYRQGITTNSDVAAP